jgi:hypothetical protein
VGDVLKILSRIGNKKEDIIPVLTAISDTSILIDYLPKEKRDIIKDFLRIAADSLAVNKNNIHEVVTIITNLMQAMEIDENTDEYDLVEEQKEMKTLLQL